MRFVGAICLAAGTALLMGCYGPGENGTGDKQDPPGGGRTISREEYEADVARLQASVRPQDDILRAYAGVAQYSQLELAPLAASYSQAVSVDEAWKLADFVVEATVLSVRFEGSSMGDLPAMVREYRVESAAKGGAKPGDILVERVVGGPYRDSEGKVVFVTLPRGTVDVPGDRVLLFLDDLGAAGVGNHDISVRFKLDGDGRIAATENADGLRLAGKTAAEVLGGLQQR